MTGSDIVELDIMLGFIVYDKFSVYFAFPAVAQWKYFWNISEMNDMMILLTLLLVVVVIISDLFSTLPIQNFLVIVFA